MKIYIVTYHHVKNYGGVLQAYALNQYLIDCGVSCSIVNYQTKEDQKVFDHVISFQAKSWKNIIINFFDILHYYSLKESNLKFKQFVGNKICLTRSYYNLEDLQSIDCKGDLWIVGSDQVWNCSNGINKQFFLPFINDAVKCSYGSSLGIDRFPEKSIQEAITYLNDFKSLSVREKSARDYLENLLRVECSQVVDPIFLLSALQWRKIEKQVHTPKQGYILVYSLSTRRELINTIDAIKKATGLPAIEICANGFSKIPITKKMYNVGPEEFLYLIDHATYIIASSFHAVAFSVLFNKNFYTYVNDRTGSRVYDFLTDLNLENRIINGNNIKNLKLASVDYTKSKLILNQKINESKLYLDNCICICKE